MKLKKILLGLAYMSVMPRFLTIILRLNGFSGRVWLRIIGNINRERLLLSGFCGIR